MLKYRTITGTLLLALMLLIGLVVIAYADVGIVVALGSVYAAFAAAIVGLGAAINGKSSIEKLADGKGVKAVVNKVIHD